MKPRTVLPVAAIALLCCALPAQSHDQPAESPDQVAPLPVGAELPDVKVRTAGGDEVDLRAALGKTPTILIFYRGGW